jgi:hypothetical protein
MKALSAWIWIISSILFGILVLTIGAKLIIGQLQAQQKHNILNQADVLYRKMNDVCSKGGIGELYSLEIGVPEITKAIYVCNETDEYPPDKISEYISKGTSAIGSRLCLQFFDDNIPKCLNLPCQSKMTYMGTPSMKSDLPSTIARILGTSPVYKYRVFINKTDDMFLTVKATQIIK